MFSDTELPNAEIWLLVSLLFGYLVDLRFRVIPNVYQFAAPRQKVERASIPIGVRPE
jgi:hypothetical protein